MKKITAFCLAALLAATGSAPAFADRGGHDGYRHYERHQHQRHHQGHRSHHDWIGPAAVLGIGGLIIGSAIASQYYAEPAPVYRAPPPPAPRAAYDTWYYCGSSGQYYPYTNACPEGWQAVPAR